MKGRIITIAVAAVAFVGIVSAVASAAPPTITFVPPSAAEEATLSSNSVSFAFTYTKKPQATQTMICTLSGPTSSSGPCDTPVAFGEKGSQSGKSYSALANGEYTFTVSLTLTDGGTTSATRHFTVAAPSPRPRSPPAPTTTAPSQAGARSSAGGRTTSGSWETEQPQTARCRSTSPGSRVA